VRVGVHTGNVFAADEDFLGRAVVLAARITAHARGGEILISAASHEYTRRTGRWRYGPGEDLRLKGIEKIERVCALDWSP
jgi:class 3 adenylate cyclase